MNQNNVNFECFVFAISLSQLHIIQSLKFLCLIPTSRGLIVGGRHRDRSTSRNLKLWRMPLYLNYMSVFSAAHSNSVSSATKYRDYLNTILKDFISWISRIYYINKSGYFSVKLLRWPWIYKIEGWGLFIVGRGHSCFDLDF